MRAKLNDSPKAMTGHGSESARKALERQLKAKPRHPEAPPAQHKPKQQQRSQPPDKDEPWR